MHKALADLGSGAVYHGLSFAVSSMAEGQGSSLESPCKGIHFIYENSIHEQITS